MTTRTLAIIVLLVCTLALFLPACGSGTENENQPTPTVNLTTDARVAFIDTAGNVAIMNADGSGVTALTTGGGATSLATSADASLIAAEFATGVRVFDAAGRLLFERQGAASPTWATGAPRLAVAVGDAVLGLDAAGELEVTVEHARRASWSPDGTRLAVMELVGENGTPVIVDAATGAKSPLSAEIEPHIPAYPIAWHPNGVAIAYRDRLYDLSTETQATLPGIAVGWSPDGRMLMVTLPSDPSSGITTVRLLDATQGLKEVIGMEAPASTVEPGWLYVQRWVDWSPDGTRLVYMDPAVGQERVRVFNTVQISQDIHRNIKGELPDISPEGEFIVFMDTARVWLLPVDGSALQVIAEGTQAHWIMRS